MAAVYENFIHTLRRGIGWRLDNRAGPGCLDNYARCSISLTAVSWPWPISSASFTAQMAASACGDQPLDDFRAGRAAVQRPGGIVPHLARELRELAPGDVREIGDDQLELALDVGQQIAFLKEHAFGEAEPLRIFTRQRQRVGREIDCFHLGLGPRGGKGERNHPAAGADIERAPGERLRHQQFAQAVPSPGAGSVRAYQSEKCGQGNRPCRADAAAVRPPPAGAPGRAAAASSASPSGRSNCR